MIKLKKYTLGNILLSNDVLNLYISKFWNDIFNNIHSNSNPKHLYLMCKVLFTDESLGYRTLGHLVKVNFEDKDLFINYLQERLGLFVDAYTSHPINTIQFSYIVRDGLISQDDPRILFKNVVDKAITFHIFNNKKLPISMNPEDYGSVLLSNKIDNITRYIVTDNIRTYQIDVNLDLSINTVTILGINKLKWIDTKLNDGFMREIGKSTIYFLDGEIILQKQERSAKPFKSLDPDTTLNNSFFTFDIETINIKGKLTPYLINAYNGTTHITSYANKALDQGLLFGGFITSLVASITKPCTTNIYAHNLSGFDGIFLLKHLINSPHKLEVHPLVFNGRIISITFKTKDNKTFIFKDSYLLLPLSLRKLCSAFNVSTSKGYFPFNLNNIFYSGLVPRIEYWSNIPLSEYGKIIIEFNRKEWNFKNEAIKYCRIDCIALFDVLIKFNELIFDHFQVNANKCLTLPSLAMRIFKSKFMSKDSIFQILGKSEEDIRLSYTGGAVDMYIPHNKIDNDNYKKLFYYDVNSLYPTVMSKFKMPIGKPTFFEGDILKYVSDAFGFFYCKITSPEYLEHPILQRRIKTSDGIRTIAGLGSWEGWIFSEEMRNAINYGYKFEVIKGYTFEEGDLFSGYVDQLYKLRKHYKKLSPINLIAKLLMNSLYGKFGMKVEMTRVDMFDCSTDEGKEFFKEMLGIYGESIADYVQVGDSFLIIRNSLANLKFDEVEDLYHGLEVNIAIASAVTAYARIAMSEFKNNPNFNLYYSDTDSIVIDRELPDNYVGNELGQLKLEHVIDKAVFLAPKVYGIIAENGEEVIKVKGLSDENQKEISVDTLENLLFIDSSKEFTQEKKDILFNIKYLTL
jgi:hypothetical protein